MSNRITGFPHPANELQDLVNHAGIDLVTFEKWQRKDDVTQKYLRRFTRNEGVLYVGKAQEKARIMRTERRRSRVTAEPIHGSWNPLPWSTTTISTASMRTSGRSS